MDAPLGSLILHQKLSKKVLDKLKTVRLMDFFYNRKWFFVIKIIKATLHMTFIYCLLLWIAFKRFKYVLKRRSMVEAHRVMLLLSLES